MQRGSLIVASAGIGIGQCTVEARSAIEDADIVLSVMGDPFLQQWVAALNPKTRSLQSHYGSQPNRRAAYSAMVDEILVHVRAGLNVCAVFYGHAGVYVTPSHEAIAQARAEGFDAIMLPGVSADACLVADLGVDPGAHGFQSYEAHAFFRRRPRFDTSAALVLWQLAVLGDDAFTRLKPDYEAVAALATLLCEHYPVDHRVAIYAASTLPVLTASVQQTELALLATARIDQSSTLYVPALALG